jgi:predicted DNA-binding protein (MmcQ/YjbR family)
MDIEKIRNICMNLPSVKEGLKWGNDLCFMIGEKMFCAFSLTEPLKVSLKVTDEEFDEISSSPEIISAPYAARHKWILVENVTRFNKEEWEHYITQSYNLVKSKLSKKKLAQLLPLK